MSKKLNFKIFNVTTWLTLIWGKRGNFTPPVGFPLLTQKLLKLLPWHLAAFSSILSEKLVPNLVSLTRPSLQILSKTQTEVFPLTEFLFNSL